MAAITNIIYLFGASCSGKSTLGKALFSSLGHQWTYIDRDVLIEQGVCSDSTANAALEERVQQIKNRVIIDAQIPWRKKNTGELYFVVQPPLQILLERDAARTITLARAEKLAHYARDYVIETHRALAQMDPREFDRCFDSSILTVQDEVNIIQTFKLRC